jgi:N-methylhydantoinase B
LGYLGTDTPLGGTLTLDTQLAENALRPVADTLGMTLPQLARGMLRISNAKIMGAVRGITIELGLDPKDFALLSFGGGGGLVAVDVARELGVPTVVVPPGSGAFSALGMLMADVQHDFARTAVMALADADLAAVASDFEKMEAEAALLLAEEGFGSDERRLERTIDVRYSGQEHSVTVECPSGLGDGFDEVVSERFAQAHERQYGHTMTDPIEITTLRVHGVGVVDKPSLPKIEARIGELPIAASRTVYMGKDAGEEYALYVREELRGGDVVHGPAVITEHTATTVMHSGDTLTVGSHGELIISIAAEQETTEQEIAEQEIAMTPTDPITIEVVRHGLIAAAEEMARNLCRTAYNTVVYEIHDYGLGIHDVNGDVVADVPGVAEFTRGNDYGVKKAIEFVGIDAMGEGDVFIVNYPYWSSAHTLDPLVLAPAHHDGKLIGFVTCRVHVLDLKQKDAGYVLDSTDMYQEGIFFPVVRLYQGGKQCDDIFNIVRFNSRMPERTIGDIQAQVSACFTGQRRMREIAAKYGNDTLHEAMAVINAHGEKLARLALTKLPKGTWTASDFVDSDGVDLDTMVKLNVTVTVTDDEFVVDWTGSATGVRGPINVPVGDTQALCCLIFKSITTPDSPVVAGNFAPLRVVTEPGSVMHAIPPMPTFTMWTGILAGEVVLKALAQGMPDIVPACSGGDICSMMGLGVNPRNGEAWLEATNEAVGFGAHAAGDGEDGIMHITEPGCRNNPVEVLESKSAMVIDYYGYRPDTGGAGEYRGGVGVSRVYRFTAPSTAICIVYKTKSPPWAMAGGSEGVPNQIVVNPGTENEVRKGGSYNLLEAGEVLANNTGGGGGYGDPLRRAPAKVARDAQNGFVSVIAAEREYGVVVDAVTLAVDETATTDLRAGRMRA